METLDFITLKHKLMRNLHTIKASIAKEMLIYSRYVPNLVGTILQLLIRIIFFMFISGLATFNGQNSLHGKSLFVFFGASFLLFIFFSTAIWAPLNSVSTDLYNGTLEYIYFTPASRYMYYLGIALSNSLINLIFFVPVYVFLAFYSKADLANLARVLLVTLNGLASCISIGVLLSLLGIVWKQVGAITGILSVLFEFLAGAYAPVQQYSVYVRYIAYLLPFTWGYDLNRYYLLNPSWRTLLPVSAEWMVYTGMTVIYLVASILMLRRIEKRSYNTGLNLL